MIGLEQIQQDFRDTIGGYISSPVLFSFDKYQKNKASLLEDLGNQYIYTRQNIVVEIKEDSKLKMMREFIDKISGFYNKKVLYDFLEVNGVDGFFENKITKTFYMLLSIHDEVYSFSDATIDGIKSLKLQQGMKISKVLKYFIKEDSAHMLYHIQTKYSQIINGSRLSGNLSLSIHPLDYLSMSHNNENWRSCQSLDGEYASGTLSLMCDQTTLVAYLASPELQELDWGGVRWNSKKWRVLVHIDKTRNRIVLSKHYPFYSYELETQLVEMIKEIYPQFKDSEIQNLENSDSVISKVRDAQNYNDIARSNGFITRTLSTDSESEKILIGTVVPCLHCGKNPIEDAMSFACYHCMPIETSFCDRCETNGHREEDMYWVSQEDRSICSDCFNYAYDICDSCSYVIPQEEMSSGDMRICKECEENHRRQNEQSRSTVSG
jgi:hypothetical protein